MVSSIDIDFRNKAKILNLVEADSHFSIKG